MSLKLESLKKIKRFTQLLRQRARLNTVSTLSLQKKNKVTNQISRQEINWEVVLRRQFCIVNEIEVVFLGCVYFESPLTLQQ